MIVHCYELVLAFLLVTFCFLCKSYATPLERDVQPEYVSYSGYQLWRLTPTNEQQLQHLLELWHNETNLQVDFWVPPVGVGRKAQILVPPQKVTQLDREVATRDVLKEVLFADVNELLERQWTRHKHLGFKNGERILFEESSSGGSNSSNFSLSAYNSYEEVRHYIKKLERKHPNVAKVFEIGKTSEDRPIEMLQITNGDIPNSKKRAIWIDGCMHSREWISMAVALYTIDQLVQMADAEDSSLYLDKLVWYILPVANPDGYEHSRLFDRMWRKNRSRNDNCFGVDLNRNFDFYWKGARDASFDACTDVYHGPSAFSELETQAVRDQLLSRQFHGYVSLHSFAQVIMHPFGHDYNSYPADVNELRKLGKRIARAIESNYGSKFTVDTGAGSLYPASGVSSDWAKARGGVKFSYLMELRPAEDGQYGFVLPEDQILPAGKETFDGLIVLADAIIDYVDESAADETDQSQHRHRRGDQSN